MAFLQSSSPSRLIPPPLLTNTRQETEEAFKRPAELVGMRGEGVGCKLFLICVPQGKIKQDMYHGIIIDLNVLGLVLVDHIDESGYVLGLGLWLA